MVQFNFRLQSVLEYRRSLADQLQIALADRERQLRDAERRLAELYSERDQATDSLSVGQDDLVNVSQATHIFIRIDQLELELEAQSQVIERARADYEQTRSELIELEKSAKTLEKLRDRQQDEWATEELRREQTQLSELAAVFHQRANGG
ncbi:MAG: flagellar export protein FliJ [Chloroflexota bacterium]